MDENKIKNTDINELIEEYIPFIIKTISKFTNRYVSIENDEEFSIGLVGFYEAVQDAMDACTKRAEELGK